MWRLFNRTTRSVLLTDEGEQLLDCVRRALSEVEAGLRKISESVDLRRGHALSPAAAPADLVRQMMYPDGAKCPRRRRPQAADRSLIGKNDQSLK